jgi:hypothetical protein
MHQAIQDSVKVTDAEEGNDGGAIAGRSNRIFGK